MQARRKKYLNLFYFYLPLSQVSDSYRYNLLYSLVFSLSVSSIESTLLINSAILLNSLSIDLPGGQGGHSKDKTIVMGAMQIGGIVVTEIIAITNRPCSQN